MKNTIFGLITAAVTTTLLNTGCHPDNPQLLVPVVVDSGKLYLHLHTNIDTNEVAAYNDVYTTSTGRKVSLSLSQLYISNIKLLGINGQEYSIPDKILLKTLATEQYFVANVPVSNFNAIKFLVGVENATVTSDVLNHPEMWFGTTAQSNSYVFVNLQGKIDTTANATGTTTQMQPFIYKIGGHRFNTITMPVHNPYYTVVKDQPTLVHITIDYNKLFTDVQLNKGSNLMITSLSDNDSGIINIVNANIASMFSYEE